MQRTSGSGHQPRVRAGRPTHADRHHDELAIERVVQAAEDSAADRQLGPGRTSSMHRAREDRKTAVMGYVIIGTGMVVELRGIEPLTSSLRTRRSPS